MNILRNFCLIIVTLTSFAVHSDETTASAEVQDQLAQLIDNHTQFAFSLYTKLDSPYGNLVFSPYSTSSCLSMAYLGARDITQEEMQQVLKLDFTPKEIAAPSALLNKLLSSTSNGKGYELNLANALWLDERIYILADYRYAIEKQFGAKIGSVFFSQPNTALATINKWVADKTKGHIQNLLTQNDISTSTRLILTNAAYFKGSFMRPFNPQLTCNASFYPTSNTSQIVDMMQQTAFFPYVENELFQAIALPFNGGSKAKGQLALFILLPKSAENFEMMSKTMPDSFEESIRNLKQQKIALQLPKFVLSKRYGLNEPLQQLGMKNPFTTQANFSGIDGLMNLCLNQVVHETYFALDENGVTAAAATGASMDITSAITQPMKFIADHPFLFFIVDLKSTEVLFIGKFADPTDIL